MTNASTRKSAAAAKRSPLTLAGVGHGLQGWLIRNKFYIIAFFHSCCIDLSGVCSVWDFPIRRRIGTLSGLERAVCVLL